MSVPDSQPNDPYSKIADSAARGAKATVLGMLASAALGAVKIIAGILGHSFALIADGVESVLDVVSSIVVWGSLTIAASPPSEQHPYGYGKAEPLGAMVVATALLVAALGIAIQSVREIIAADPERPSPAVFTLFVLMGVVVVKEALFRVLTRTGDAIGSKALQTDAWHHRSDALTSLAAFIGISIALVGGKQYNRADDWAALFACAVIAFNGVSLFRSALGEVLDVAAPAEIGERIRRLASAVEGVVAIEKCRVRKSGLGMFIDIHVIVAGDIPVSKGHVIAHKVKDALLASDLSVLDVAVHIEPDKMVSGEG